MPYAGLCDKFGQANIAKASMTAPVVLTMAFNMAVNPGHFMPCTFAVSFVSGYAGFVAGCFAHQLCNRHLKRGMSAGAQMVKAAQLAGYSLATSVLISGGAYVDDKLFPDNRNEKRQQPVLLASPG